VSPTLVREALRRLEAEGLVTFDLHKGSTVVAVDYGATQENYRIRAALESLGAELAADSIEPEGDPRAGGHHRRHGGDR
jgi:DNA-binding GntR family transcriptional regulator